MAVPTVHSGCCAYWSTLRSPLGSSKTRLGVLAFDGTTCCAPLLLTAVLPGVTVVPAACVPEPACETWALTLLTLDDFHVGEPP
jgi:hypothetical protein